ncbi:MAG: hypothetical protein QM750_01220 [Rubrivivax sp.]
MKTIAIALSVLLVAACASQDQQKIAGAATTPLNDLNLVSAPIPEALSHAQKAPYAVPAEPVCAMARAEIRALDEVLGADLDTPATDSNPSLIERGGGAVANAIQKTAEGVVPFRSWVRKLSGAERYSRQVAAAIAAGTVRRAYLKGVAQAKGC